MTDLSSEIVLHTFLLFCRIGGCLMFMPGFSSPRVPVRVRIFIALAATLVVAPIMLPELKTALPSPSTANATELIFTEITKGALIGVMGRIFFLALEFIAAFAASLIGFTNMPGVPIESTEAVPAFATLITLTATVIFFLTDQHWEVLRAILASYRAMPLTAAFGTQSGLAQIVDVMAQAFFLGLQIASPFIIYSLGINLLFGIANKLTPQIPVYFVSLPFIIAGGVIIFYFILSQFFDLFIMGFSKWLVTG
jgi:flagellar biosynthetic protein FliR